VKNALDAGMNGHLTKPIDMDAVKALLSQLCKEQDPQAAAALPEIPGHPGLAVWQGDITRLKVDAIVNAANSALLGCFLPCHGCIDNAIHSAAGLQLREECHRLMEQQGHEEPTGQAKLTGGYNLPAKYVLHTVGPIVGDRVTEKDRAELAACYRSCLELAAEHGLESVAFCCISTGVFHFPNREAAEIAVQTVTDFLKTQTSVKKVIFNVFKDLDAEIYHDLLG
ncbi:MAG: protein-ADP-ribose hydrolase, partial [Oscillospiraceae bacterium]|nr:protein-ADP-ribose hydrolase [Oscillospiraceae bacterium]